MDGEENFVGIILIRLTNIQREKKLNDSETDKPFDDIRYNTIQYNTIRSIDGKKTSI